MRLPIAVLALHLVLMTGDAPTERGTLRLHYVQKEIGFERYALAHDNGALTLTADVDFTDRGGRIQLASTLRMRDDFTPIHFTANGKSYRYVNVDSDVAVDGSTAIVKADGTVLLPANEERSKAIDEERRQRALARDKQKY